ncbi:hypothetical protein PRZ48_003426 [Zasmidium cellare]|uniref:Enoyl reductase (ER) domain-containing protein n=1 Tax=Zasmidium cellare TaxID=395010 RepID=A0ABR0EX83_ZASCE|nr:hypothetical protein PRZ48_003426 [Zasmidium cellare]
MSSKNEAAYLDAARSNPLTVKNAPEPEAPPATKVVIQAKAIALNPMDAIIQQTGMIVPAEAYPYILGCDVAGEVAAVGSSVSKVKPGDRVLACAERGCFQKFNTVDQSLVAKIPDNVKDIEACVLPLALCTAAVTLFQKDTLALDLPQLDAVPNGKVVLAWGGASAVGTNGIQLLKAAGYDVAAVAGERNHQYCRALGADHLFDHKSANVEKEIVESLRGKPFAGVACFIMSPDVIATCARIADQLGDNPKNKFVGTVLAPGMDYEGPLPEGVSIGYTWGDSLKYNEVGPAIWDKWLTPALADGSMKCKPDPEVIGKGLGSVQAGLDQVAGGVSAKKIVIEIE